MKKPSSDSVRLTSASTSNCVHRMFFLCFFISSLAHAIPDWAKQDTFKVFKDHIEIVCSGEGPSLDLARDQAISSCQASAARQMKTEVRIKSLSVETEKEVGFHQEVAADQNYRGLVCMPLQEKVEKGAASFSIWIRCKFDIGQVITSDSKVKKRAPTLIHSQENKKVNISTIPQCDSIFISGAKSRIEKCASNPIPITIQEGDVELIVRAKGRVPETISLLDERLKRGRLDIVLKEKP